MPVWWRWPTSISSFFFSFTVCLSLKRNQPWCNYYRQTLAKYDSLLALRFSCLEIVVTNVSAVWKLLQFILTCCSNSQ
jgi:hypothetical protein